MRSSNPRHRSKASRRVKRASSIARAAPENMSETLDLITASSDASALGHTFLQRSSNIRSELSQSQLAGRILWYYFTGSDPDLPCPACNHSRKIVFCCKARDVL